MTQKVKSATVTSKERANGDSRNQINGDASIAEWQARFNGQALGPGDAGYDEARTTFYGGFDYRPLVVIRAGDEKDVAQAVTLARESGLPLAVRSGGHSFAGHSVVDGGIVLDLSPLRDLQINVEEHTVWAQTGLTAGEVTNAAAEHGLAIGFGDTGSVGIGGITLGGGAGFLSRKYGLTIDALLAAEVVTADGQLLYTDAETNPDLFWAIRGGGGNFGVATRFKYRLFDVDEVLGGFIILPATAEVIEGFIAEATAAPEELTTIANIMVAPPMPFLPQNVHGSLILFGLMVYAGPPAEGEKVVAPFRALAEPLADMLRPMHYPEIFFPEEGDYHPTVIGHTFFMDKVERQDGQQIIDALKRSTAPMAVTQLRVLGGAVSRVSNDATAYAHRDRLVMANVAAFYNDLEDKPVQEAWVHDLAAALEQGQPGAYVNFLGAEEASRIHDVYPQPTWERLRQVKAVYDPENLFRVNMNVPPADGQ